MGIKTFTKDLIEDVLHFERQLRNEEAQRFYRNIPDSIIRDEGIWIDIK